MTLPDKDDLDALGGALNDYEPVDDPTTQRAAADANKAYANVAMMSRTAIRAWARFVAAASTGAMSLSAHEAVWGNSGAYAPTLARTGTGVFTITWPASVPDQLGEDHAPNFFDGDGKAEGSTFYQVQVEKTAPNVLTVRVADMAGSPSDAVGKTIKVWAI